MLVGSAIAALAGFDIVFDAITGGHAWLRVMTLLCMVFIGLFCAKRSGLELLPIRLSHPFATAFSIAFAVASAISLTDCVLFREILPDSYVTSFSSGNGERMVYYMLRAFNENLFYRLFFMSALCYCLGFVFSSENGEIPNSVYWFSIIIAQTVSITINVIPLSPSTITPIFILYVFVRFICAGILWGYIYWKNGFVTAEIAHVSTHIFLQPVLGYALGHS